MLWNASGAIVLENPKSHEKEERGCPGCTWLPPLWVRMKVHDNPLFYHHSLSWLRRTMLQRKCLSDHRKRSETADQTAFCCCVWGWNCKQGSLKLYFICQNFHVYKQGQHWASLWTDCPKVCTIISIWTMVWPFSVTSWFSPWLWVWLSE